MAVTPILQDVVAFDVTEGTTIYFNVSSSTEFIRSSIVTFADYDTGDVVATNTYRTTQLYNVIPPNLAGLSNGEQYRVYVDVYTQTDPTGHESAGTSTAKPIWCLPNPTITFTAPAGEGSLNIETSTYTFSALFEMYTDASLVESVTNKVQSYQFDLYNGTSGASTLADTSGLIYGTGTPVAGSDIDYILDYTFNGLLNNNSYYVVLTVITEQGMSVDNISSFVIPRLDDITFASAQVDNNSCEGYIEVRSNITNIIGHTNVNFIEGSGEIDLTNYGDYAIWGYDPQTQEVEYNVSFPNSNWSVLISAKNLIPSISSPNDNNDKTYMLHMSSGNNKNGIYLYARNDDDDLWIDMYIVRNTDITYMQSNSISKPSETDVVYILLRNSDGWSDIQLSDTLV